MEQINSNKNIMFYFLILAILNICQISYGQTNLNIFATNPCLSKLTCRECIQTRHCSWCSEPDFGDEPRCFEPSSFARGKTCDEKYTFNPDNSLHVTVKKSLTRSKISSGGGSLSSGVSIQGEHSGSSSMSGSGSASGGSSASGSGSSSASGSIVQIYPQRVSLKCRINEPYRLEMAYAQAEDYPVDLYYLMDLSKSMEDDKEKLSLLGDQLTETMTNITSNFRLGFGSFVDKVLMPYVSTVPKKLKEPCDGCAAPYGYRNQMRLSKNTTNFSEQVKGAEVSGNLDAPEGGFDAIMQAVVCRDQIGWRDQARRLLVFSTDAGFHYAGDGKLGGVITPNDGECHLDNSGIYTHSKTLDYPSISQINLKVKQNAINMIFAVTKQQEEVYKKLSEHIEGSSTAVLEEDSSNVVTLVEKEYNKISSTVEIRDTSSSAIKIKYSSSCLSKTGEITDTNKCAGLKVGDTVNFVAEITVTSCPANRKDWKQTFQIYPVGVNESLTVDLEMLCDCPCEKPELSEPKSSSCNGHGTFKCGICECDEHNFGRKCECSITDIHSESKLNLGCRVDNTTMTDCSGRGTCVCGVCECDKRTIANEVINGKYCECDNFSCDRHNELVCSGPSNGDCECGKCKCHHGWEGDACECSSRTDTCMNKNTNEICSNHGTCECGECRCESTDEGRYSGTYCEKCPTCAGRCEEFKDCVQCQMYKTGPLKDEVDCARNCTQFVPTGVETVVVNEDIDEHMCIFYDEDDCKYQFVYSDKEPSTIQVRAQQERECPPKVFIIGIVLAVIAAIVLIGLAILLLWKFITTIHDRREFARFEKERMMAKWDTGENPIYKQATSTFKNPTYAGK